MLLVVTSVCKKLFSQFYFGVYSVQYKFAPSHSDAKLKQPSFHSFTKESGGAFTRRRSPIKIKQKQVQTALYPRPRLFSALIVLSLYAYSWRTRKLPKAVVSTLAAQSARRHARQRLRPPRMLWKEHTPLWVAWHMNCTLVPMNIVIFPYFLFNSEQ